MAGCEGICDGLPGVAQPSLCQEVIIKKTQLYTQLIKQLWNLSLNGIWTNVLCDAGALLYQQSYQANWEPITLVAVVTALVSQRQWVWIPIQAWIIFPVTAMTISVFISFSAVEMYDWSFIYMYIHLHSSSAISYIYLHSCIICKKKKRQSVAAITVGLKIKCR